jgi:hypothetical protein
VPSGLNLTPSQEIICLEILRTLLTKQVVWKWTSLRFEADQSLLSIRLVRKKYHMRRKSVIAVCEYLLNSSIAYSTGDEDRNE